MPSTFAKKHITIAELTQMKQLLRASGLHTVCESARCPNIGECFQRGTATLLIAGDRCTRGCRFCSVQKATPLPVDPREPENAALLVERLGLSYVVITSVTRDDLTDGAAEHFRQTVGAIRARKPGTKIEILVPDFSGNAAAAAIAFSTRPEVFAHNLETVPRLYPAVRSGADYRRSLNLLAAAARHGLTTKSGLMLGLGETTPEIEQVIDDLRQAGCSLLTLGQYLAPAQGSVPVAAYISAEEFSRYRETALAKGFSECASGSFVRSSYRADELFAGAKTFLRTPVTICPLHVSK
jgi:lipoic acid synthetase